MGEVKRGFVKATGILFLAALVGECVISGAFGF
jgi:hypothetical protein